MTETRYVFGNLRTGTVTEEIALQGVSMDGKLNSWGSFRGTFALDQTGKNNADLVSASEPLRNFVVAEQRWTMPDPLDPLNPFAYTWSPWTPVWGGIVWTAAYQSQAKIMQVTARSWEAYLDKIRITTDQTWTNYEQRNIFRELWNNIQANTQTNLGVIIPSAFPDVVLKTVEVFGTDRKRASQIAEAIADGDDGFDWYIATGKSGGNFTKTLRIGYPKLGDNETTPINYSYPGQITNYYETRSGTPAATHLTLLGAGEGDEMLFSDVVLQDLIDADWLEFDDVVSLKDINNQPLLDSTARRMSVTRRPPMSTVKAFVKGDVQPRFGEWALGSYATLTLGGTSEDHRDPRFPTGKIANSRVVAYSYHPPSDDSVGEVELIFEGDELND